MIESGSKVELQEVIEETQIVSDLQDSIYKLDALLIKGEQVDCPIDHQFCQDMYLRERFVPAGTLFTTYTWKEEHPFFGNMGELLIWEEEKGWVHYVCPCRGITKAGTKRIVYAITDVIWTTVHANPENITDVEVLEDRLLYKYENPYLSLDEIKQINQ